ncbi:MAG: hypothetical protein AAB467_03140 [Patescibacteria group bacterium]
MSMQNLLQKYYRTKQADLGSLENKMFLVIAKKQRARRLAGVLIWSVVLAFAASGFIASLTSLVTQFSASGIGELLSTIFSDSGLLATYSSDFIYSLAESAPVAPLIEGLFTVALGMIALREIIDNENHNLNLYGSK